MNVSSSLNEASLEQLSADPASIPEGRIFENTTDHKAKVVLAGAIQAVVTEGQTQTVSGKTFVSPVVQTPLMSGAFRMNAQAAPANPAAGEFAYYTKNTDNKLYRKDSAGVEELVGGNYNVDEIKSQMDAAGVVWDIPLTDAPNTAVLNRAKIPDLSQDLSPRWGATRYYFSGTLLPMLGEMAPNGSTPMTMETDYEGLCRFIGSWVATSNYPTASLTSDFMEITFYGTGLNILAKGSGGSTSLLYTLDGGTENAFSVIDQATTIDNSGSAVNRFVDGSMKKVVGGLTLGLHTVKLRFNGSPGSTASVMGYEVLVEKTDSKFNVAKGTAYKAGKKYSLAAPVDVFFNSGFTTAPSLANGGRVVAYLDSDNTVKKAITVPAASPVYYPSSGVVSANEEVFTKYFIHDFLGGNANSATSGNKYDFYHSSPSVAANQFGVSNDGLATLSGYTVTNSGSQAFACRVDSPNSLKFTFFGTGLDVNLSAIAAPRNWTYKIDNVSPGVAPVAPATAMNIWTKIASDLPLGWHTFELIVSAGTGTSPLIANCFQVWRLKKPTIPTTSIELADYSLLPTYATNAATNNNIISPGSQRRAPYRDMIVYAGTGGTTAWGSNFLAGPNIALQKYCDQLNCQFETAFYGTGIETLMPAHANMSSDMTLYIDDQILTSASFPGVTVTPSSLSLTYNPVTGSLSANIGGTQNTEYLVINGLTIGSHRLKIKNNVTSKFIQVNGFSVICPVLSTNTPPVGYDIGMFYVSQGIHVNQGKYPVSGKKRAASISSITDSFATQAIYRPLAGTCTTYVSEGETVLIYLSFYGSHTAASGATTATFFLNENILWVAGLSNTTAANTLSQSTVIELKLPKGIYKFWGTFIFNVAGTASLFGTISISKKGA